MTVKNYKHLLEFDGKTFLMETRINFRESLTGGYAPFLEVVKIRDVDLTEQFED